MKNLLSVCARGVLAGALVVAFCIPVVAAPARALAAGASSAVTQDAPVASTAYPQSAIPAWTKSLGSGGSGMSIPWAKCPTPQIIANGALYFCSDTTLYACDLDTGKVLASAQMEGSVSYGGIAPTYADGMVYVSLGGGKIEAFAAPSAASLTRAWSYTATSDNSAVDGRALVSGGQSWMSPFVANGRVIVGWYGGDVSGVDSASLVCLDAQKGTFRWGRVRAGGFYHAGAVSVGSRYVFVTGEDGSSAAASNELFAYDRQTGVKVSSVVVNGDVRSVPVVSEGKIYFTGYAGKLYRVSADEATGALSGLQEVGIASTSISTPLIYGGRAYVGTYSSLDVIDVSSDSSMSRLFGIKESRGIHATPVLSTAKAKSGCVEVYYAYYKSPGGVDMQRIPLDAISASAAKRVTVYKATGHAQYCNCGLVAGSNGLLYYKNDSLTVFALKPGSEVSTVTVNAKTVTAAAVKKVVSAANSPTRLADGNTVATFVLGSKCKNVSSSAFKGYGKAVTVQLGKNVRTLAKNAFKGAAAKTVVVKTKKLSAKRVKGAFKGSKVTTVKVDVGKTKVDKKYVKAYKKAFTKKNCGKKVTVKR